MAACSRYCHNCGFPVGKGYLFCPNCGTKLLITGAESTALSGTNTATNSNEHGNRPTTSAWPKLRTSNFGLPSFKKFKREMEAERQSFSIRKGKGKKEKIVEKEVTINIGIMQENGAVKRGENLPLTVFPSSSSANMILEAAVEKHSAFNKRFKKKGIYTLVYRDGTEVIKVPRTEEDFTPLLYKEISGLGYARIVLYLQKKDILSEIMTAIASSSDSDVADSDPDDLQLISCFNRPNKELRSTEHGNDFEDNRPSGKYLLRTVDLPLATTHTHCTA